MTSMRVICGLGPPQSKILATPMIAPPWLRYCTRLKYYDPNSRNRQDTDVSKHLTDNPDHKIDFDHRWAS